MDKSIKGTQKLKNRTTIRSSNFTSRCIFKENEISIFKKYLHYYVHYNSNHNSQDMKTTSMSTDRWMTKKNLKMCFVFTMECYSDTKKKGILSFATTQMNLENIMIGEMSVTDTERKNTIKHHLHVETKKVELTEAESMTVVSRVWGNWGEVGRREQTFSDE